jgi:hypothetical protein
MTTEEPKQRLTLQDVLAGITCIGVAAGLVRFIALSAAATSDPSPLVCGFVMAGLVLVPAMVGAATACFALGWRRARQVAIGFAVFAWLFFLGTLVLGVR